MLERTDSPELAELADVVFAKPLTIALVLVVAFAVALAAPTGPSTASWLRWPVSRPPADGSSAGCAGTALGQRLPAACCRPAPYSMRSAAARPRRSASSSGRWPASWSGRSPSITILGELGIDLGPLVAGAGIAGVAIGFGAQSLVKDFLAGMFILVEDQYGVGDIIDVGD